MKMNTQELEVPRGVNTIPWVLGWQVCVIAILTCATIMNTWAG